MTTHSLERVLVSLGSNIEPERHLRAAVELLAGRVRLIAVSRVYRTAPVGGSQGAAFLNAAVEIRWDGEPERLKYEILRPLEQKLGRVRTDDRNAPRTIDLDISLFGSRVIRNLEGHLEIPDPEILTRAHVAIPLADVAPAIVHPVVGETLDEIARRLDRSGVGIVPGLDLLPESDRF